MKKVIRWESSLACRLAVFVLLSALVGCAWMNPKKGDTLPDAEWNLPGGDGGLPGDGADDPADYVYIRSGASGGGTSWADARGSLPNPLVRGKIYWMAGGIYDYHTFGDIAGSEWIQIRRATASSHGGGAGWSDAYDSQAVFREAIVVYTDYLYLNGRIEDGIKVLGTTAPSGSAAAEIHASHVGLVYLDIDANFQGTVGSSMTGGSVAGLQLYENDNVVMRCKIHNCADDGVPIGTSSRLLFTHNRIYDLWGTAGAGSNGHSDGLEIAAVTDSVFEANYVVMASHGGTTSCLYFNDVDAVPHCARLAFRNNVFYFDGAFGAYFWLADGIVFVNNTVWGWYDGGVYGAGLVVGAGVTDLHLRNNIIQLVHFMDGGFDSGRHSGDHNLFGYDLGQWPLGSGDKVNANPGFSGLSGNPRVNPSLAPSAFRLAAGSPAANSGAAIEGLSADFEGTARPQGSAYDIGAFESY